MATHCHGNANTIPKRCQSVTKTMPMQCRWHDSSFATDSNKYPYMDDLDTDPSFEDVDRNLRVE
eukprot:3506429-Pyramimonas_sp.AAC.1